VRHHVASGRPRLALLQQAVSYKMSTNEFRGSFVAGIVMLPLAMTMLSAADAGYLAFNVPPGSCRARF